MDRVLTLLRREISGLHEAAFLLAVFALLSKILALLRDRILAHLFGANIDLDIYYAAFRIPDFLYVSIVSLVASSVLVPFIVERLERKDKNFQRFFNSIFSAFFLLLCSASIILFFIMPYVAKWIIPGLGETAQKELVVLSRIMLISPIFLGISGIFASITQSLNRFLPYAIAPVLYNIGIIFGILVFYPTGGMQGLAYGVVLGAFFHLLVQIPVLWKSTLFPRLRFSIDWTEVKNVFFHSFPRTITLSLNHLTLIILVAIASFMEEGSIAIFNFSLSLQSVPLSIIGVSYSIAAFPTLARFFSKGETQAFREHIVTATRHIIFWSMPVLVLFIVLRAQIVRTILGTGKFDWIDTRLTAATLALFVISVIGQSLILLFVRGYYAAGFTRKPLFINLFSLVFIVFSAFALVYLFKISPFFQYIMEALLRIEGLPGGEIIMLPLAFSLGTIMNALALWFLFRRDFSISSEEVVITLKQSFYSSVVIGFVTYQFLKIFEYMFDIDTLVGIFFQGLLAGLVGILAGILVLKVIKNKEIEVVEETLKNKFWKVKTIAPDQGVL